MRRLILILALCAFTTAALAADTHSFSFGTNRVYVGDSSAKAYVKAGKPDRVVQLTTRQGGGAGERWEYFLSGYNAKTVHLIIRGGVIQRIIVIPG